MTLNLKELKIFVPNHHFKMNTLKSTLNMTKRKRCFITSIDLTDAYHSWIFQRKFYRYACVADGLTSVLFAKSMKPVFSTLTKLGYNVSNYLDDIFISGDTFAECTLREKCPHSVFFWCVFFSIRTEYWEIRSISPYSVRMRNTDTFHAVTELQS